MGLNLWKTWKNYQDEKQLAKYAALDAELGTPTTETLNERAQKAADRGLWKTALAAVDAGADVNAPLTWKQFYPSTQHGSFDFEKHYSLAFAAIEQDNAEALAGLLKRGAKTDFTGTSRVNDKQISWTLPEYAAMQGAKKSLPVLLANAAFKQEALDGALVIAAGEKAYLGMAQQLLDKGAAPTEKALRAAELRNNKPGILLIKGALKKAFEAAQKPAAPAEPTPLEAAAKAGQLSTDARLKAGLTS